MEIINVNTVDVITPNENTEILGLQNGNPIRINAAGLLNSSDVLKCTILTEEEYFALAEIDPKTMYVITGINETTGTLEITSAYLGELKFATGGGTDTSGIPIEVLELSEYDVTIEKGASKLITASWQPTDATNTTLSWMSSNTLVASVNSGTITGNQKGTAVITVKARSGVKETVNVTVIVSLVSLEIQGAGKIVSGYDEELTLIPTPSDADLDITVSSSNSDISVTKSANANKLIASTTATSGSTTIRAVNFNGKEATINLTVVPYIINVTSDNIDKTDSSVTSIFTNWTIERKGTVNSYKYTESYMKEGVKTILQQTDYTLIPDSNVIQIELYAEFGNKIIDWTFKDENGLEETITCNVYYKEPELVHYSFDIDIICSPEEAANMTANVPYFKYDKKFSYNLRNDDTRPSLWRNGFRYVNREITAKINGYVPPRKVYVDAMAFTNKWRAPRRLGYTDGCGNLKVFNFDTAGTVQVFNNSTGKKEFAWEMGDQGRDCIDTYDMQNLKDYGGHFLLHNMEFFEDDEVKPKFNNDYSYPLQRDRQAIYDHWGYTSVHYANPDGAWWYTRPCIKDPKTLLLSGGGAYADIDPNNVYGRPANRSRYNKNSNLSLIPLSEIRNTVLFDYDFNNNNPYSNPLWKAQLQNANSGVYTTVIELTHSIGGEELYAESWLGNRNFFQEIYDVVGANGNDYIWFCSGCELIEYMYYQRVAKITKTITPTGCSFNISFDIPDYLSYKTYSVILNNLPVTANVSMSTDETLTYFSKNLNTGLINWGVSPDISERANRYLSAYLANPTNDTLDRAWYFIKQMGELGTSLASQLPAFNEKPYISNIDYNATPIDSTIDIAITNSNKEFGEADYLDISTDSNFSSYTTYQIPFNEHKYYDELDSSCLINTFTININPNFGVSNTYYARLRNFYGNSNTYVMNITLTRTSGVNDPAIEYILPAKFTSDTEVTFTITSAYISAMRYKLTDTFTDWMQPTDSITIPMTKGTTYNLVVQGKNNLDEIVEKTYTINFTGKQQIVLFGNVNAGFVTDLGYVNKTGNAYTSNAVIKDLEGNTFCTEQGQYTGYFQTQLNNLRLRWGITEEVHDTPAYWNLPSLINGDGDYPNSIIVNGTLKNVTLYVSARATTLYQAVKYLTGVPTGTYNVRLLMSRSDAGATNDSKSFVLRVNNTTQTIKDTTILRNNNTIWQEFNGITVTDGHMLISQYPEVVGTGSLNLAPIVLIEITKVS